MRTKNIFNLIAVFFIAAIAIFKATDSAHGWFGLYFILLVAPAFLIVYVVPAIVILVRNVRNRFVYYQYLAVFISLISSVFIIGDNGDSAGQYWLGKEYMEGELSGLATIIGFGSFFLFNIGLFATLVLVILTSLQSKK